jgi:hypothetical protein
LEDYLQEDGLHQVTNILVLRTKDTVIDNIIFLSSSKYLQHVKATPPQEPNEKPKPKNYIFSYYFIF